MTKYVIQTSLKIAIGTTDSNIKSDKYDVIVVSSEDELIRQLPSVLSYGDTEAEALADLPKQITRSNAKNHIAITSMANSIMLTTFYLYADTDKNSTIDKEKLKLAMRELLRCQAIYVKTNDYGLFDPIALNDLKDVYDLMEQEDKDNIKDNLEIYSGFEPKAPFMEFYKLIGGMVDNA